MTNADTAPAGERNQKQSGHSRADQHRYAQIRGDVDGAYDILRKNSKTLNQHTKTLGKHGTGLRWIKRAQADHTIRLQRIEDRLDGMDTRLDGMDTRLDSMDQQLDGMNQQLDGMNQQLDGMDQQLNGLKGHMLSIIGLLGGDPLG